MDQSRTGRVRRTGPGLASVRALAVSAVVGSLLAAGGPAVAQERADGVPSSGATSGTVTVVGSGFGHGVGMSQYGSLGMAQAGASASTILRHYYAGTTVASYLDDVDLRVNVVDRGTRVTLRTTAVADGGGRFRLYRPDGSFVALGAGDVVVVQPIRGGVTATVTRANGATSTVTNRILGVRWSGSRGMSGPPTVLQVDSGSADASSTWVKSRRYRYGALTLNSVRRSDSDGGVRSRIEANVVLNLHREYLRGLAEVPASWPAAALQTQVIAARNYALGQVRHSPAGCGGCTLWDDTRSQVYRGWEIESSPGGSRWVRAVTATQTSRTRALVVLSAGRPITAYYSSSTGGRTRSSAAAWGSAVSYLRSVDDPWSRDPAVNPSYARWTRSVPVETILAAFGLPDLAELTVTARDAGGAVTTLRARSADGTTKSRSGNVLRGAFGLPAQWITSFRLPTS